MNRAAASLMTDTVTIWQKGDQDQFGNIQWGSPETIKCNIREGGKLTLDRTTGEQFVPSATIRSFNADAKRGDKVAVGDFTAQSSPEGLEAYTVREVLTKTPFRGWRKRYDIITG